MVANPSVTTDSAGPRDTASNSPEPSENKAKAEPAPLPPENEARAEPAPLPCDQSAERTEAIASAQKLVRFASQNGHEISKEVLDSVFRSAVRADNGNWNTDDEAAFWRSYRELSKLVSPVTVDTIQATVGKWSKAARETFLFSLLTGICLILLIGCQIFWVIGNNVTAEISAVWEKNEKSKVDLTLLNVEREHLVENRDKLDSRGVTTTQNPENGDALSSAERTATIDRVDQEINKVESDIQTTKLQREQHEKVLNANFSILEKWVLVLLTEDASKPEKPGFFASDETRLEYKRELEAWQHRQETTSGFQDEYIITWARSILGAMSTYFLPMLYGLVGACAYILRSLSKDITNTTFASASVIQYRLRLPLGMLSGIAVGWFFKVDAEGVEGFASIQPLALAFLAGYSVELLFTAIDKLITAFAGDDKKVAKA